LEGRRQHVGKQLEGDGKQKLHKGNNYEYSKWYKSENIGSGASQLSAFSSSQALATSQLKEQPRADFHIGPQQFGSHPIVLELNPE
jgi:hypothetical protein